MSTVKEDARRIVEELPERVMWEDVLFNNYRIMYRLEIGRILGIVVAHAARDWNRQAPKPWDVV